MNILLFLNIGAPEIILILIFLCYPLLAIICLVDIARQRLKIPSAN